MKWAYLFSQENIKHFASFNYPKPMIIMSIFGEVFQGLIECIIISMGQNDRRRERERERERERDGQTEEQIQNDIPHRYRYRNRNRERERERDEWNTG